MMTTTRAIMTMRKSNISGSMNTLTLAKLPLSARFQVTQSIPSNRSSSDLFQIVIRSSRQSSSWRGTFWSTARQRLFSVMSVIERFDARIIWGITRKFTTPGRPSTLALMIPVPAPTTQWPVSENTRLVGSQKLGHKRARSFAFRFWRHSCYAVTHLLLCCRKYFALFYPRSFHVYPFCHWQTLNNVTTQLSFNPFIRQCTLRRRASLTVKSAKWCFPAR